MEWLIYLLKVSACMALFFGFYLLFLSKLTFFKLNRFYLLSALLLSFIIPALQINVERKIEQVQQVAYLPVKQISSETVTQSIYQVPLAVAENFDWMALVPIAYVGITLLLILILLVQLFRLIWQGQRYSTRANGLKVIVKTKGFTNCSFFNYVFVDQDHLDPAELEVLLKHEAVHAGQYHSIDKIILMVCKAVLWFNPVVYLMDKALEQVHEYEADEISASSVGPKVYAGLLLKLAIVKSDGMLIHNFVKSPIKERIKMLFHTKTKTMNKLNYVLILPIILCLGWFFSIQLVSAKDRAGTEMAIGIVDSDDHTSTQNLPVPKPHSRAVESDQLQISKFQIRKTRTVDTLNKNLPYKVVSFTELKGDQKSKIIYLKNVIVEFQGSVIKAASATINQIQQTLSAERVSITKSGNMVVSEKAVFDLSNGTYKTFDSAAEKTDGPAISISHYDVKDGEDMIQKSIRYMADSIRMNKDRSMVNLIGHVEFKYKDYRVTGSQMIYYPKRSTLNVADATFFSRNSNGVQADSMRIDMNSNKIKAAGTLHTTF